jgi:hypothetical protein
MVMVNQALCAKRAGEFWAVVRDSETGEILNEVLLYKAQSDELVELQLKFLREESESECRKSGAGFEETVVVDS